MLNIHFALPAKKCKKKCQITFDMHALQYWLTGPPKFIQRPQRKGHGNRVGDGILQGATLLIVMYLHNAAFGHLHMTSVQSVICIEVAC